MSAESVHGHQMPQTYVALIPTNVLACPPACCPPHSSCLMICLPQCMALRRSQVADQNHDAALLAGYPFPSRFHSQGATVVYLAPELLEVDAQGWPTGNSTCIAHHQAADIWAAACTAFRILNNGFLFLADASQPVPDQKMQIHQQHASLVRLRYTALPAAVWPCYKPKAGSGVSSTACGPVLSCRHFGVHSMYSRPVASLLRMP